MEVSTSIECKRCANCHETKPLSEFNLDSGKRDGHGVFCSECSRQKAREYYKNNKEKVKAYQKEYEKLNRKKVSERHQKWIERNQDRRRAINKRYTQKNRERINQYTREYRKTVRGKQQHVVAQQKRRAQKIGNGGTFSLEEWLELCQKFGNVCLCCGEKTQLTIDHIVPISLGGSNSIENIQPLCKKCNSMKFNKTIDYRVNYVN